MQNVTDVKTYVKDVYLADRYGVSRQTIWQWVREGRFPAPVKLGTQTTRWHMDDVLDYEGKMQVAKIYHVSEYMEKSLRPIGELNLSNRAKRVLMKSGVKFIEDLEQVNLNALLRFPNIGMKTVREIESVMRDRGLVKTSDFISLPRGIVKTLYQKNVFDISQLKILDWDWIKQWDGMGPVNSEKLLQFAYDNDFKFLNHPDEIVPKRKGWKSMALSSVPTGEGVVYYPDKETATHWIEKPK